LKLLTWEQERMSRVFIDTNVDTNVPMYAAGKSHHLKEPCQRVILAIAKGELNAVTDTEVFQEILYRYLEGCHALLSA
jgi:predicted nucleic acid-binding protein